VRLEETLEERSPRAMLESACRPLAVLGRRASALANNKFVIYSLDVTLAGSSCDEA